MAVTIIDTGLRFEGNHSNRVGAPKGIVLHHAAGSGSVQDIHRTHLQRGYAGIGYHLYVRRDGKVYRGRPEGWLGAHATGYNDRLGVCAEGNFEQETMSAAQKAGVIEAVRYLLDKYGTLSIVGHREVGATACPGKNYPFADIVKAATSGNAPAKENAVKRFQQACLADGIALPRYGADGVWGTETQAAADRVLSKGDRGARVKLLQTLLQEKGYALSRYGADGDYGQETEQAVNAFKKAMPLPQNGRVGIKVWKALTGV